jgi:proteasome accessory factor B
MLPRSGGSTRYSRHMRRIERLINLIAALLDTERPLTSEEIRERIGGYDQGSTDAFKRAFERDKESLRAMGIPLELVSLGAPGMDPEGYVIPKDKYYLPELDLEPDELAALRLAAEAVIGGSGRAESGLVKLSVDAPTMPWTGPRVVWGADVATEQPLLGPLYEALLERIPVRFEYEVAGGDSSARSLEIYGIVHRSGHWYAVGRDTERDAVRSFKLTRIVSNIERGSGTYEIPPSFDAQSHLAGEPWEIGDRDQMTVVVRFDPMLAWWPEQNLPEVATKDTGDGAVEVEMQVVNLDAFLSWIIGFGDEVEIVSPAEARERLLERLRPFTEAS